MHRPPGTRDAAAPRPGRFFALALGLSWGAWIPAAVLPGGVEAAAGRALLYAGGLGPLLAALGLLYTRGAPTEQREYWRRLVDPRRIGASWYAVILLLPAALVVVPALLAGWSTGAGLEVSLRYEGPASPSALVSLAVFLFVFGPLPEEMAWRGYALDRLQAQRSALGASLVLWGVWALWHVPLFLIEGTYQHDLGFGTEAFWRFLLAPGPPLGAPHLGVQQHWPEHPFRRPLPLHGEPDGRADVDRPDGAALRPPRERPHGRRRGAVLGPGHAPAGAVMRTQRTRAMDPTT